MTKSITISYSEADESLLMAFFKRLKVKIQETVALAPNTGSIPTKHEFVDDFYAPNTIIVDTKKYFLNFPLRCNLEREEGYFVITNEMLDIVSTGLTEDEAKNNFNQEFDYIYTRYNELKDEKLSERILNIKKILQIAVKLIE